MGRLSSYAIASSSKGTGWPLAKTIPVMLVRGVLGTLATISCSTCCAVRKKSALSSGAAPDETPRACTSR